MTLAGILNSVGSLCIWQYHWNSNMQLQLYTPWLWPFRNRNNTSWLWPFRNRNLGVGGPRWRKNPCSIVLLKAGIVWSHGCSVPNPTASASTVALAMEGLILLLALHGSCCWEGTLLAHTNGTEKSLKLFFILTGWSAPFCRKENLFIHSVHSFWKGERGNFQSLFLEQLVKSVFIHLGNTNKYIVQFVSKSYHLS